MTSKELEILENITPVSGAKLADIDFDIAKINSALNGITENYKRFAKCVMNISNKDISEIGGVISFNNLQKNATQIVQYISIVQMLIANSRDDIKTIHRLRIEWQNCKINEIRSSIKEEKRHKRNLRESERIKNKRNKQN